MQIEEGIKLDFDDVLIKPKRSTLPSRDPKKGGPDVIRELTFIHSGKKFNGVPIMASNMDGVGTFSMARQLQKFDMFTVIRKHYNLHEWHHALEHTDLDPEHIAISTGTNVIHDSEANDYGLLKTLLTNYPQLEYICIDVANGYQENFVDFVKRIRDEFPDKTIMAGNVVTSEIAQQLVLSGADVIKVGIGPGSVCTTRTETGIGYPQLSAIIECADIVHHHKAHVIADGGCKHNGDIAKAFGAGADFVMLGGMLAGHAESEEQIVDEYDRLLRPADGGDFLTDGNDVVCEEDAYVRFYGMSSDDAMERHGRRKDGYIGSEGKTVLIPYRGFVQGTAKTIIGRLRSSCTYIGAERLKEVSKRTTFVRVNRVRNQVYDRYDI